MVEISRGSLSEDLRKKISEGFTRHAIEMTGYDEKYEAVAFVATEAGCFVGAIVVELFWGALHVKYVFVEDPYRARHVGTQLMDQALAYGREHQCPFAFVETMDFQALGFYQKMGFKLEFTRIGYKHGTAIHYLKKDLP